MSDKRYTQRGGQQAKGQTGDHRSSSSTSTSRIEGSDFFRFDARIQAPDFVLNDMAEENELEYGPLDDGELTYEDDGDFLDSMGAQPTAPQPPQVTRKTYNKPQPQVRKVRKKPVVAPPVNNRKSTNNRRPMNWQDNNDQYFDDSQLDELDGEPVFGAVPVYESEEDDPYLEDVYEDTYGGSYEDGYESVYDYPEQTYRPASGGRTHPKQLIFGMVGIMIVGLLLMSRPLTASLIDTMARNQNENIAASVAQADIANNVSTSTDTAADSGSSNEGFGSRLWGGAKSSQLAPFFSQSVLYWEDDILYWAERHNLDPNMVATVMQIESCGDPRAQSGAGAMGLFQVMPFHFQAGEDGFEPDTNALRGMNYLAERLIQTGGEIGHAFAGYNGGQAAAASNWSSWANETQRYYVWTTGVYSDALNGNRNSTTLNEWLQAGGASLCVQAEQRLGLN